MPCHNCGSPWFEPGIGGGLFCCDCNAPYRSESQQANSEANQPVDPASTPDSMATYVTSPEPRTVLVLSACGHWRREHQPAGLVLRPDQPRLCTGCPPDSLHAVGTSEQGWALVPVEYYLATWTELATTEEQR